MANKFTFMCRMRSCTKGELKRSGEMYRNLILPYTQLSNKISTSLLLMPDTMATASIPRTFKFST